MCQFFPFSIYYKYFYLFLFCINFNTFTSGFQRISHASHIYEFEKDVKPFKEEFGTRIFVRCEEINFRLQAPLETEKGPLCQVIFY